MTLAVLLTALLSTQPSQGANFAPLPAPLHALHGAEAHAPPNRSASAPQGPRPAFVHKTSQLAPGQHVQECGGPSSSSLLPITRCAEHTDLFTTRDVRSGSKIRESRSAGAVVPRDEYMFRGELPSSRDIVPEESARRADSSGTMSREEGGVAGGGVAALASARAALRAVALPLSQRGGGERSLSRGGGERGVVGQDVGGVPAAGVGDWADK